METAAAGNPGLFYLSLAVFVLSVGIIAFQSLLLRRAGAEFALTVREILEQFDDELRDAEDRFALERRDLLDRLMARDLSEVKTAQTIGKNTGRGAVSRWENTRRIINEVDKITDAEDH